VIDRTVVLYLIMLIIIANSKFLEQHFKEAKCRHHFHIHELQEQHKSKYETLHPSFVTEVML